VWAKRDVGSSKRRELFTQDSSRIIAVLYLGPQLKVLFLISGLGMGNSTRCHAVIAELEKAGATIAIMSSGNGVQYFHGRSEVSEIHETAALRYGSHSGRISIARTLALVPEYYRTLSKNRRKLEAVLDTFQPDVAVLDSFYVTEPLKRRSIPIVAINNSDFVLRTYFSFGVLPPASTWGQFFFVEQNDYIFHRFTSNLVLSPSLYNVRASQRGRFQTIGPLVRPNYQPCRRTDRPHRVLVMLSGSAFGSQVTPQILECGLEVDVVGRERPDAWPDDGGQVKFHGKVIDNRDLVANADVVVVNCGYSAVSEMLHVEKPMVVVPVRNHAEQWVNATVATRLGVGRFATEANIVGPLKAVIAAYADHLAAYDRIERPPPTGQGRRDAAAAILKCGSEQS